PLAVELASYRCGSHALSPGKLGTAMQHAANTYHSSTLAADIALVLGHSGYEYSGPQVYIRDVLVPELRLEHERSDLSAIEFQDSIFGELELTPECSRPPIFVRCYFNVLGGRAGMSDLPQAHFIEPTIEAFENPAKTTDAILGLSLPLGAKV